MPKLIPIETTMGTAFINPELVAYIRPTLDGENGKARISFDGGDGLFVHDLPRNVASLLNWVSKPDDAG
jgi:hypothetical protein